MITWNLSGAIGVPQLLNSAGTAVWLLAGIWLAYVLANITTPPPPRRVVATV